MLKICRKHISLPYRVHERKCYEEVFVQHDSSPPANMTEREKVLVGSLPPPPVSAPVLADLGVFASISSSNHNGDTASLRDSVERLRRQSSAVLSEERGNRV